MHKQVSGWTVNFGPNSPVYPLLRNTPPPILENFRFGMTKVYSGIPPPLWKTSDLGWPKFTPEYPPPIMENFRFGMTKVYSGIPPPIMENFRFGMTNPPPPIMENFRFGMTKVYSEIPPHYGKLQIWDDQSLLRNTPPIMENFRFGMTKIYSEIPPPPLWKTSDLGWPKFTPKYPHTPPPPIMENFRFGMTKVYSEIPPPPQPKIVREFKSKIFRIPRVTTCGDFIQPG